jgi:hypothetical protein
MKIREAKNMRHYCGVEEMDKEILWDGHYLRYDTTTLLACASSTKIKPAEAEARGEGVLACSTNSLSPYISNPNEQTRHNANLTAHHSHSHVLQDSSYVRKLFLLVAVISGSGSTVAL